MTWCSLFADRATRPRNGGVNGDPLIKIQEEKHPELIRDGNDLIYNLMLDFPTAALGGSAEVPTVEGPCASQDSGRHAAGQGASDSAARDCRP